MRYPVRKVFITQSWGNDLIIKGVHIYYKFGFKGHNGLDLRIFNNDGIKAERGDLIAPHNGEVIEARFSKSLGWYYKIENDKEGSILGHNSSLGFEKGDKVWEGQLIGITGNSGLSTHAHCHWGYYLKPRDRNNGYGGTINQVPLIEEENMPNALEVCMTDREKFMRENGELYRSLGVENQSGALVEISKLQSKEMKYDNHECPEYPSTPVIEPNDKLVLTERVIVKVEKDKTTTEKYTIDQ